MVLHGDRPRYRPALRDLDLPPLGGRGETSSGPLMTPTLLIMNHGGRGFESAADAPLGEATSDPTTDTALLMAASTRTISAYDKVTGERLGPVAPPATPGGNPMTYLHEGKQ